MPALIQFVDSISASPTVRLDINDSVAWFCTNFSAPLPRLRRSESGNSMRDGGVVGSATYENRTLEIELTLVNTSTEDAAATEMQKLWRELDRPTNYLRYQREGMTKPVFFRLFRSDASDFEELWTTPIARNITLEILAEPFALGLPESLGPYSVSNNPATAGGLSFTIPSGSALGDVPAPFVLTTGTTALGLALATGAPKLGQAESSTTAVDTANPGGGPDAVMSGTGTNNYLRTSFATTPTMIQRWSTATSFSGLLRVGVFFRRSDATSVINVRTNATGVGPGQSYALPLTTQRRFIDLGMIQIGTTARRSGYGATLGGTSSTAITIEAERVSGSGTVDWDAYVLIPADVQTLFLSSVGSASVHTVDGVTEAAFSHTAGDPVNGTVAITSYDQVTGGFPWVQPGVANTYTFVHATGAEANSVSTTVSVSGYTWPRYLYIRPVST